VYFLFETNVGDYEIQFGDGRLGRNLNIGQRVVIKYLDSRGTASSGANTFTYTGSVLGSVSQTNNVAVALSNVNIPSYGGAPRESIDSIKRLAPNIYQAQGRVVTPDDARATLLSEVSGIDSLTIWGGEDNDPPTYGKMFICLKPVNAERFGPTQKAQIIKNVLRPKASPILGFEAVDPDYIFLPQPPYPPKSYSKRSVRRFKITPHNIWVSLVLTSATHNSHASSTRLKSVFKVICLPCC
jgi:hypothetical protein